MSEWEDDPDGVRVIGNAARMGKANWQEIRALRASPTGLAASDHERRKVFTSALRQSEELARVVTSAGYATKPLMLFYCLSQGLRAASAAHVADDAWIIVGHGARISPAEEVMATTITPNPRLKTDSRDSLSALHELLVAGPMTQPMTLGEVWLAAAGLPDIPSEYPVTGARSLILRLPSPYPDLHARHAQEGVLEVAVEGLSPDISDEQLVAALAPYPSLGDLKSARGLREGTDQAAFYTFDRAQVLYAPKVSGRPVDMSTLFPWISHAPVLFAHVDGTDEQSRRRAFARLAPTGIAGRRDDRLCVPAVGGSPKPEWPALYWLVLLALSSLVRYEPAQWITAVDADHSTLAVPLEQVCDQAEKLLPIMLHSALTGEWMIEGLLSKAEALRHG